MLPQKRFEKQSFLTGAMILSVAGLISQLFGVFSKIFLLWLIGEEGVGIYNYPYPFFAIILSFSSIGFNVAISKLVSEFRAKKDEYHADKVFRLGMKLSLYLGMAGTLLLFLVSYPMASWVHRDNRALFSYIALAPTAFLTSFQAVYRGYFQGLQNMKPNAISQLIEQGFRILVMLSLAWLFKPFGLTYAAAGATLGAAAGAIGASLYLRHLFQLQTIPMADSKPKRRYTTKAIYRKILQYAIPISFAGIGLPTFLLADSMIITNRLLAIGVSLSEATASYGIFSNNAMSLITLPTIITGALFVTLVPAIAEAKALQNGHKIQYLSQKALHWTLIFALPAAVGMWNVAPSLTSVLKMGTQTGLLLQTLTYGLPFIAIQQVTSGLLQGMGFSSKPVQHMMMGALAKFVGNLIFITLWGIQGAAWSTVLGFFIAASLNTYHILRYLNFVPKLIKDLLKPCLATTIMALCLHFVHPLFLSNLSAPLVLGLQTFIGILVYALVMLLSGGVQKSDLALFRKP